jgi:hypothetical protein
MARHEHEHERHKAEGGGVNVPREDIDTRPEARTNAGPIDREAEEKHRGGKAKRHKRAKGGKLHHVDGSGKLIHHLKHASMEHHEHGEKHEHMRKARERRRGGRLEGKKHLEVHGEHEKHRADRKPRKDGGRTGADSHPFSSARHGVDPPGHKTEGDADYE